jgi:hypothetical protein
MVSLNIPNDKTPFSFSLLIEFVPCTEELDVPSELIERETNFWCVSQDSTTLGGP